MMKVTIIPSDKSIYVEDESLILDMDYDNSIHAIQWDGTEGIIEYVNAPPKKITDIEIIQPYIDAFKAEKSTRLTSKEINSQSNKAKNALIKLEINNAYMEIAPELLSIVAGLPGASKKIKDADKLIQKKKSQIITT